MASDVEVDRAALEHAGWVLEDALGRYRAHLEDAWRRDTGVEDPCGRTQLRVLLEDAIGGALMAARAQVDAGVAVTDRLRTIGASFSDLDASLGAGWQRDYVTDLA